MPSTGRVVVLSDVHLAAEGPLAAFRDDVALAGYLRRQREQPPTELVLAGDVFDVLATPEYAGLDPGRSPTRFNAILQSPRVRPVVDALRAFSERPGHEVTVLAGNHDPELLLPGVREVFERAIGRPGTVGWADDAPLVGARDGHRPIWGRRFAAGPDVAWVVHGDRWDPHNFVDRARTQAQAAAGRRVDLPVGSHVVFEVLSTLQQTHAWVYELKPEVPAVFLLLLYLDPARTLQFLAKHFGINAALLRGFLQGVLRDGPAFGDPIDRGIAEGQTGSAEALARWIVTSAAPELRASTPDPARAIAAWSAWCEHGPTQPGTLAAHGGVGRAILRAWLRTVRGAGREEHLGLGDDVIDRFDADMAGDVTLLVAGHTHGPRCGPHGRVRYANTGTWLPIARVPEGDVEPWIDELEAGRWTATSPRTAVELELGPTGIRGSLLQCDDAGRAEAIGNA